MKFLGYLRRLACAALAAGIDRDPPACSHIQGDVTAERQPFVVGVVLKSCGLGRGHHGERCAHSVNC